MKTKIDNYDWKMIQDLMEQGKTQKELRTLFHISRTVWEKAKTVGKISYTRVYHKQSEQTKKILSNKMKSYLKSHPEKHVWKRKNKFKSTPCEYLKKFLCEKGILFAEEYTDEIWEHSYSIDIAFISEKIGIEVNGNQHYDKNGKLTDYYLRREEYLKQHGWKIIEIPYFMVWNESFLKKIFDVIKNQLSNCCFDYAEIIKNKLRKDKEKYICAKCGGNKKTKESVFCMKCASIENGKKTRKVERPDKITLEKEVKENSFLALSRKYGVSDNAIRKWCIGYGIEF